MTKIITFCEGVTDLNRSFELRETEITLLAPTGCTPTGDVLGIYAFQCSDCDEIHVRAAGKRLIESLVLLGVMPATAPYGEIATSGVETAIALLDLERTPLEGIVQTLLETEKLPDILYL